MEVFEGKVMKVNLNKTKASFTGERTIRTHSCKYQCSACEKELKETCTRAKRCSAIQGICVARTVIFESK